MKKTTALIISVFIFAIFTSSVSAQARIPLVVAPARQTVALDPGKSENLLIKFFNERDRRENQSCAEVFPEMKLFLEQCNALLGPKN